MPTATGSTGPLSSRGDPREPQPLPAAETQHPAPVRDWIAIATWCLLAIGIAARLLRFVLRFPLWGDECLLATNFIDRDFIGLLRPLDNHQVAPVAFLWLEEAATRLFGFSEYSLRLWPLMAGLCATVLLFRFARRELPPLAALFAVGFFAVSSYAIRHAVEVKPYAIDAFATTVLLSAAWPLWRRPADLDRLWLLAPLAGLAVLVSYPSVFVVGAIGLVTLPAVLRSRRPRAWLAMGAFGSAVAAAFALMLATSVGPQFAAEAQVMRDYWAAAFPPLGDPLRLPLWLVDAHTGEMFAYPLGGERGGSVLTFLCFATGIVVVWRTRAWPLASVTLATLALAFVAAALQRYPYGGHPRLVQYAAPLICLLAGAGLARILASDRRPRLARNVRMATAAALALIGCGLMIRYVARPYQDVRDVYRREAVIQVWQGLAAAPGPSLSVEADLHVDLYPESAAIGRPIYRCNEQIYASRDTGPIQRLLSRIDCQTPLNCVALRSADDAGDAARLAAWLDDLAAHHRLVLHSRHSVAPQTPERVVYEVFCLAPQDGPAAAAQVAHGPAVVQPPPPSGSRRF